MLGLLACGPRGSASAPAAGGSDTASGAAEPGADLHHGRSAEVERILEECKIPDPPDACVSDGDCATVDIDYGECDVCPVSLRVGVTASRRPEFEPEARCKRDACSEPFNAPCLVHRRHPEAHAIENRSAPIVVRCIREGSASHGVCRTQYSQGE